MEASEFAMYQRQISLPQIGIEGQRRLKGTSVLLVGAGGLGSPCAIYLATAGIGRLGIVDGDRIDISNLHRQVLYNWDQIGQTKASAASQNLTAKNPFCDIEYFETPLTSANGEDLISRFDIVVEGSDNFATKYLTNQICVRLKKPLIFAAVLRSEGQMALLDPARGGPCYSCIFPEPPDAELSPNCSDAGVVGMVPGVMGILQASETVNHALGRGQSSRGLFRVFDLTQLSLDSLRIDANPNCAVCGVGTRQNIPAPPAEPLCVLPSSEQNSVSPAVAHKMIGDSRELLLIDVRSPEEFAEGSLTGARNLNWADFCKQGITKSQPLLVFCLKGMRSRAFLTQLLEAGYTHACHLQGGYLQWLIAFGDDGDALNKVRPKDR